LGHCICGCYSSEVKSDEAESKIMLNKLLDELGIDYTNNRSVHGDTNLSAYNIAAFIVNV